MHTKNQILNKLFAELFLNTRSFTINSERNILPQFNQLPAKAHRITKMCRFSRTVTFYCAANVVDVPAKDDNNDASRCAIGNKDIGTRSIRLCLPKLLADIVVPNGSASCIETLRQTAAPFCIRYAYAHGGSENGKGAENKFFEIPEPAGTVSVVRRTECGGNLGNGLEFLWCDGSRATIAETMRTRVCEEEFEVFEYTKEGRDEVLGEGRMKKNLEFCEQVVDGWGKT